MSVRPRYREDSLIDLLEEERPEAVDTRRAIARAMLQLVPAERLRAALTPVLAGALLETTRLGAVEDEALAAEERDGLLEARRILAGLAAEPDGGSATACQIAGAAGWHSLVLHRTGHPRPGPAVPLLVLDEGEQRVDEVADELRELLVRHGDTAGSLYVARTRIGPDHERLPPGWTFGVEAAIRATRAVPHGAILPRWAAVGCEAGPTSLDDLPPDVRVVLLERGARPPEGLEDWGVGFGGLSDEMQRRFAAGDPVCLPVTSGRQAARVLAELAGASEDPATRPIRRPRHGRADAVRSRVTVAG